MLPDLKFTVAASIISLISASLISLWVFDSEKYWICFIISTAIISFLAIIEYCCIYIYSQNNDGQLLAEMQGRQSILSVRQRQYI